MTKLEANLEAIKQAGNYFRDEIAKFKRFAKEEDGLLLPAQAAAMLGISPQAIESRMKEKSVKTFTVMGRQYLSGRRIETLLVERVRRAVDAGEDKSQLEEKI